MEIPIVHEWAHKIKTVYDFLKEDNTMLFIIGLQGGEGKTLATNEAVRRWKMDVGENNIREINIFNAGLEHKETYMNMVTGKIKIIVHINSWNEHWVAMAREWGANTVIFRRPL
jgi:hypothetical protein